MQSCRAILKMQPQGARPVGGEKYRDCADQRLALVKVEAALLKGETGITG
jgi:hypothetical protein